MPILEIVFKRPLPIALIVFWAACSRRSFSSSPAWRGCAPSGEEGEEEEEAAAAVTFAAAVAVAVAPPGTTPSGAIRPSMTSSSSVSSIRYGLIALAP